MTVREYKDLATIVAEHQFAYSNLVAIGANDINAVNTDELEQLKGCIATDERILREVLRLTDSGVDAWIQKACTWYKLHERVGSADIILK